MQPLKLILPAVLLLVSLAAGAAIAAQDSQPAASPPSWMISFPDTAPQAVIRKVIAELEGMGATITHKFSIISAYAFTAPKPIVDAWNAEYRALIQEDYKPWIEQDGIVTIMDPATGP